MRPEEIAKVLQLYMLQNLYGGSESYEDTSGMFSMILASLLEKMNTSALSNVEAKNTGTSGENNMADNSMLDKINDAIKHAAKEYNVEEELIKAIIKQESSFNPFAVSRAGAEGLMQLMPDTQKSLGVDNPFDILDNIDGGTRYLKRLLDVFGGSRELALAAYNGGIGRMKRLGVDTPGEIEKMPEETRNYVEKVIRNYIDYKKV